MTNELRGVKLDEVNRIELYEGEVVSVGSEGCVHDCIRKFLHLLDLAGKEFLNKICFRIVTPRIPEKYMASMLNLLSEIVARVHVNSIIINDYGLLYYLSKNHLSYGDIILGRTLIRTLADVPWHNLFLDAENFELRESMLQSNIMHLEKVELFKKYNVTGVELSPVKVNENIMSSLHNVGLKCYVHYNSEIATIGRTCPRLRVKKRKAERCDINCDGSILLEFHEPYSLSKVDANGSKLYPTLYNINNVIYHKGNVFDAFEYQRSDGVIFDYRICDAKVINEERKKLILI